MIKQQRREDDDVNDEAEAFQHHDQVGAVHLEGCSAHHGESNMVSDLISD